MFEGREHIPFGKAKNLSAEEILKLSESLYGNKDIIYVYYLNKTSSNRLAISKRETKLFVDLQYSDPCISGVIDSFELKKILDNPVDFHKYPEKYGLKYEDC